MTRKQAFGSLYTHGFVRVAVCVPEVTVASPAANVARVLDLARDASANAAALAVFPELCLSAYSNEDLFHQEALLAASLDALAGVVEASRSLVPVLLVGAPLVLESRLFNCAVAVHHGRILGVVPKTYLPNYREFYEKRQFQPAAALMAAEIDLLGQRVPAGNDLVFRDSSGSAFTFAAEICEDVWVPIPPSTYAALAGALVLANLSASNITIGKADYRKDLAAGQSGRCVAAYLYSAAGQGESSTDLAWDGDALIYENGRPLAEAERFSTGNRMITADVDLEALMQDRMRLTSFADCVVAHAGRVRAMRSVVFAFEPPAGVLPLSRAVARFPYVPGEPRKRDERCYEAYNIQVSALMKRLAATRSRSVIIGISGGLDSTHALIVAAKTMDRLGRPRTDIMAWTMPGFATSERTRANAHRLMETLGVTAGEIDIRPSCMQMFRDIGHPFARGDEVYDVTFENVQAGERTSHLFRLANLHNGIVLGTGDLSELALGWATYGVGDHMSHYGINASVPKTLIRHLISWAIETRQLEPPVLDVLESVLATEISPELVPGKRGSDKSPAQSTEAAIGPYDLQDFNLYYLSRYGFRPSRVAFLALAAWGDRAAGVWPPGTPETERRSYDLATIRKWLEVFVFRFFQTSQFKRSCLPNGPKVGSGGSLSPRGDWRAPSDADATAWLEELRGNVPES
jgi:NAD+ synthase (glutamine-hydrolysing)